MSIKINTQNGFTLIELLMYVVIVRTLLLALSGFFIMTAQARLKNQSIAEVDQQGTLALQSITQSVRNASSINTPAMGLVDSSLSLVVPVSSASPTVFSVSSGVLQMKEGNGATVNLTNNEVVVSGFSVQNISRSGTYGSVQISFTLTRVNTGNRNEFDYQKVFTTTASVRQ